MGDGEGEGGIIQRAMGLRINRLTLDMNSAYQRTKPLSYMAWLEQTFSPVFPIVRQQ